MEDCKQFFAVVINRMHVIAIAMHRCVAILALCGCVLGKNTSRLFPIGAKQSTRCGGPA